VEKVPQQDELGPRFPGPRGGGAGGKNIVVVPWDARQAGHIGKDQMQSIRALHEGFASNLTHSVAAYLRVAFSAALVSAEHLTYGEFLQRVPEVSYLATCKLSPVDAVVLLQLDLSAAFPLIDVLLGGEGKSTLPERQITGIEDQILETVIRIICQELQIAWQILALQFEFETPRQPDEVQHLMAPEEKILSLSFEITVADSRGTLNLVFPATASNALLRKLSADWTRVKPRAQADSGERLRNHLLACPFPLELMVKVANTPVRQLVGLSPGSLLALNCPVTQPATLHIGDLAMFRAAAVRCQQTRAAQVLERSPISVPKERT